MKFSRDAAISRIPAPHLLKQGQLQLADASFRDKLCSSKACVRCCESWTPPPVFWGGLHWKEGSTRIRHQQTECLHENPTTSAYDKSLRQNAYGASMPPSRMPTPAFNQPPMMSMRIKTLSSQKTNSAQLTLQMDLWPLGCLIR